MVRRGGGQRQEVVERDNSVGGKEGGRKDEVSAEKVGLELRRRCGERSGKRVSKLWSEDDVLHFYRWALDDAVAPGID